MWEKSLYCTRWKSPDYFRHGKEETRDELHCQFSVFRETNDRSGKKKASSSNINFSLLHYVQLGKRVSVEMCEVQYNYEGFFFSSNDKKRLNKHAKQSLPPVLYTSASLVSETLSHQHRSASKFNAVVQTVLSAFYFANPFVCDELCQPWIARVIQVWKSD